MPITCLELSKRAIGNALFEFATLFGVGKKLNLDIKIPTGKNHVHEPTGQNIIQLKEIFNITTPDITQEEIKEIQYKYVEKRKTYNHEIWSEVKNYTNLIGFFQSEKYFKHCKDELLKQLSFKEKWKEIALNQFKKLGIDPYTCISIHRRLGDYEKESLNPFHPVLPLEYYHQACVYIKNNGNKNGSSYLIFSDNLNRAKKEFDNHCFFVDNSEYDEYNAVVDLCMMSMTKDAIIANSTFSLWGAYLNNKKDNVIYPSLWFNYGYNYENIVDIHEWRKI